MGIALPQASAPHSVRQTAGPLAILLQRSALMASSRSHDNSLWSTPVAPFNRMGSQGSGTFCKLTKIFYFVTDIQMPFTMFASPPWIRESFRGHGFELPFLSPWRPLADLQRRRWGVPHLPRKPFSVYHQASLCAVRRGGSLVLGQFCIPLL